MSFFYFKTTEEIFKNSRSFYQNENWLDYNHVYLPPTKKWDYKKEMTIEDVDIWEIIYESNIDACVYAAWSPYAEFYLFLLGSGPENWEIETYYGKMAGYNVYKKAKSMGINIKNKKIYVDEKDMWLYTN
jgi:hypothetical protein